MLCLVLMLHILVFTGSSTGLAPLPTSAPCASMHCSAHNSTKDPSDKGRAPDSMVWISTLSKHLVPLWACCRPWCRYLICTQSLITATIIWETSYRTWSIRERWRRKDVAYLHWTILSQLGFSPSASVRLHLKNISLLVLLSSNSTGQEQCCSCRIWSHPQWLHLSNELGRCLISFNPAIQTASLEGESSINMLLDFICSLPQSATSSSPWGKWPF